MTDVFSKEKRSEVMSLIKSKNSKAEKLVFTYLRKERIYFQRHYKRAEGTPDLALPKKKKACFIDGDFWHGRKIDELILKRGTDDYWSQKILRNIERDKKQRKTLRENGWSVLTVWESDINRKRTRALTMELIKNFLIDK